MNSMQEILEGHVGRAVVVVGPAKNSNARLTLTAVEGGCICAVTSQGHDYCVPLSAIRMLSRIEADVLRVHI